MKNESKTMNCRKCGKKVENVGSQANSVTCSDCFQDSMGNNVKGGQEVEEMAKQEKDATETTEKKAKKEFGKSYYVKCSKCGEEKFAREEIYQARIKKFGSEAEMLKSYVCRKCKGEAKAKA